MFRSLGSSAIFCQMFLLVSTLGERYAKDNALIAKNALNSSPILSLTYDLLERIETTCLGLLRQISKRAVHYF